MARERFADALRDRDEISITATGRRSGRKITLPVWFVAEGESLRLLPIRGSATQWYRNLRANPTITIRAGRRQMTAQARLIRDREAVQRIADAFRRKYTPEDVARYYRRLDAAVEVPLG